MVNAIEGGVGNLISRANLLKKMQLASGGGKIMLTSCFFLKKVLFCGIERCWSTFRAFCALRDQ